MPRPYEDELLYSVHARSAIYLSVSSPKQLGAQLLGSRGALAIPDLPSRLAATAAWANAEWRLGLDDIVLKHTAAPYYTHLRGAACYRQTVRAMRSTEAHLQVRLGICTSVVRDTEYFRLCHACVAQDLRERGETFWRRTHQLPGVLVCPDHGTLLCITHVPFRSPSRHDFVAATKAIASASKSIELGPASTELALRLAVRSRALCAAPPEPRRPAPCDYRKALDSRGFRRGKGDTRSFVSQFERFVGEELRSLLFKDGSLTWVAAVARKPRRVLHPLQHLLIELFIEALPPVPSSAARSAPGGRWKCRDPELRREAAKLADLGYRPTTIARLLGVSWQTAARLIAPLDPLPPPTRPDTSTHRRAWLDAARDNPNRTRTEVRKLLPSTYAMLYRWDRQWLMAHGPRATSPKRRVARVDWSLRDRTLAAAIRLESARLQQLSPPVRVTSARILGRYGKRALFAHHEQRLPKSRAALAECCETVKAFQVRRVGIVFKDAEQGVALPDWKALREARINPDRFPDRGREILSQGRRLATDGAPL